MTCFLEYSATSYRYIFTKWGISDPTLTPIFTFVQERVKVGCKSCFTSFGGVPFMSTFLSQTCHRTLTTILHRMTPFALLSCGDRGYFDQFSEGLDVKKLSGDKNRFSRVKVWFFNNFTGFVHHLCDIKTRILYHSCIKHDIKQVMNS